MGCVMRVKSICRRCKPYEGVDVLSEWHKDRTKSSASEAYKDADYATAIWRCETETEYGWRVVRNWCAVLSGIAFAYWLAFGFVDWLKN
jgi:hypothetical protein